MGFFYEIAFAARELVPVCCFVVYVHGSLWRRKRLDIDDAIQCRKKYSVERLGDNEEAKETQPAFARRMKIKDNSEHIQPVLKSPVLYFVEIVSDLFACKRQIFTLWWGRFVPFFLSSSSSSTLFPLSALEKHKSVWYDDGN